MVGKNTMPPKDTNIDVILWKTLIFNLKDFRNFWSAAEVNPAKRRNFTFLEQLFPREILYLILHGGLTQASYGSW